MPKVSRLDVITTGSRRRWSAEEKQRIVAESFEGSRRVSATARRYGLSTSQLFTWRRQAGSWASTRTATTFTPAFIASEAHEIACTPASVSTAGAMGRMEIVLASGRKVVVGPDFDAAALARILDVLDRRA
jgi:transposase